MTGQELADKAIDIAKNYKTTYIWGGIGSPITESSIKRAEQQYSKNTANGYAAAARKLAGKPKAFYFDCVGLIKSILWGWSGDSSKTYGGAKYASNGVPDINADTMILKCSGVSSDFSNIAVGEALWCAGHIGIYIGDGLGVECTPSWKSGVQITAVGNIGAKSGYNTRKWTKHGKLPYVTYVASQATKPTTSTKPAASSIKKVDPAKFFDKALSKTYTVTASALNMRKGAGVTKGIIRTLWKNEKVNCYGYYTMVGSTRWFLVQDSKGNTGYCSSKYLK